MKNIAKELSRPVDDYLKFVQQSFNTDNTFSFKQAIDNLNKFSSTLGPELDIRDAILVNKAIELKQKASKVTIIKDINKYNKIQRIANLDLSSSSIRSAYKATQEIIKDINTDREWLKGYIEFERSLSRLKLEDSEKLHEELIILGKSILGRAIEMTPMKTGNLRRSGVVYDYGNSIVIAFEAPYATYVHENLETHHPIHNGYNCGGKAKFLELALQEFFPDRSVWVETTGYSGVYAKISINPLYLEYKHYGGG